MGKHYISKEARCPFYRFEDLRSVTCEGVEQDNSIRLNLESESYKQRYCRRDWGECRIARMLLDKYREEI